MNRPDWKTKQGKRRMQEERHDGYRHHLEQQNVDEIRKKFFGPLPYNRKPNKKPEEQGKD